MARVVKLPSGLIFRDRESLKRKVLPAGTPASMKGQFGAKAIGQFIDLADKVVSSKGIGSVASAVEGAFEDTPEQATAKLKKAAAEKRAGIRQRNAQQPQQSTMEVSHEHGKAPRLTKEDSPYEQPKAVAKIGPAAVVPAPAMTQLEADALIKRASGLPEVPLYEQMQATVARRKAAAAPAPPPPPPDDAPAPAPVDDAAIRRTKHIERLGGPLPAPEPVTATTQPGGPAAARTPQPPAPIAGVQPVAAPKPSVRAEPPVGKAKQPQKTVRKAVRETVKAVQTAVQQQVANMMVDLKRGDPVNAATIDTTGYTVANKDARTAAVFLAEWVKALDEQGLGKQEQAPINIPKTISAEALIGYAKTAASSANQQKVLEAFANNTVTGMGYTTLAERMSGAYRKPYLNAILSSFPKPAKVKDPIDALYKATLAYQSGMGGQLRSQRAQTGYVAAEVGQKRARAMQSAASAQKTAEEAISERELRFMKRSAMAARTISSLISPQLIKALRRRRGGRSVKRKINLPELRKATTDPINQHMRDIEAKQTKINLAISKAESARDNISELQRRYNIAIVGSNEKKAAADALSAANIEAGQLTKLNQVWKKLDDIHKELDDRKAIAAKLIVDIALGRRIKRKDAKFVGLDTTLDNNVYSRRRKRSKPRAAPKADPLGVRTK
jgi:hypothetical protein